MESARVLFKGNQYSDCYHFVHMALEAELKALVARDRRYNQWPAQKYARDIYSHNLKNLAGLVPEGAELLDAVSKDRNLRLSWKQLCDMQIGKRYTLGMVTKDIARDAILAAENPTYGARAWLRKK